jgi:hypothetical protein
VTIKIWQTLIREKMWKQNNCHFGKHSKNKRKMRNFFSSLQCPQKKKKKPLSEGISSEPFILSFPFAVFLGQIDNDIKKQQKKERMKERKERKKCLVRFSAAVEMFEKLSSA